MLEQMDSRVMRQALLGPLVVLNNVLLALQQLVEVDVRLVVVDGRRDARLVPDVHLGREVGHDVRGLDRALVREHDRRVVRPRDVLADVDVHLEEEEDDVGGGGGDGGDGSGGGGGGGDGDGC